MTTVLRHIAVLILTSFALTAYAQTDTIIRDTTKQFSLQKFRQIFWDSLPRPIGWTNDYEGLYTDEEERSLDSIISIFKEQTSIEIAIVTIDTSFIVKDKFDDLTFHIANTWGVGQQGKDNGILIGISRGHRKMRIQNGYGIEKLISDSETKTIIESYFMPDFKIGNYYQGTLIGLTRLIDLLKTK